MTQDNLRVIRWSPMIEPGLFRHYKGNDYRVLFTAAWADYERPQPDDDVILYVDSLYGRRTIGFSAVCGHRKPPQAFMKVKWSGNPCEPTDENCVSAGDTIIIYVSLSSPGRLSARTEVEFEDKLSGDLKVERFQRIGP